MKEKYNPVVLVILDGWGEWNNEKGNPVFKAKLPTYEKLNKHYPKMLLQASGMSVGLPWGVMGNSEVGHQTLGSGQIVYQFLPTINASIADNTFFSNEVLLKVSAWVKEKKSDLHLIGLVSDGEVHSSIDHLVALLVFAKQQNIKNVYIHAITDGRDTAPKSAKKYLSSLQDSIDEIGIGEIVSISGRYYAMDRNNNWDRIEKSFLAFVKGEGVKEKNIADAINNQYKKCNSDEYIEPIVLSDNKGLPKALIKDNDAVICFNFRKDRSRQLARAFSVKDFNEFGNLTPPKNIRFIGFNEYEKDLGLEAVFSQQKITTRLGKILSDNGKKQLRMAETEKFAHVTYFFNGGLEKPFKDEDRVVVPSKNSPSYADTPEMSAREITDKLLKDVEGEKHNFILVNYANPDMVGHTGNFKAAVKALEFVDKCLGDLVKKVLEKNGCLIVTADHGNVEEMVNLYSGQIDTEHSTNPVPCWLINSDNYIENKKEGEKVEIEGMLVDIAPTILDLFNIEKSPDMTGRSLLNSFDSKK
ncbi:2,3-bisphosphoglycerate-independent phosphoglycerate mutase [bacterium]|nr:2,3-bisphosphoglycerate-independent phosphoglycerate mutase [bacterium]